MFLPDGSQNVFSLNEGLCQDKVRHVKYILKYQFISNPT